MDSGGDRLGLEVKPVVPRALANDDVDEALAFYLVEAGEVVALRFVDAVQRGYSHISRRPKSGSPRFAHELDLPGLRTWPVRGFPYLIFFVERPDHIDVWRVLHGQRDIPAWMQDPEDS